MPNWNQNSSGFIPKDPDKFNPNNTETDGPYSDMMVARQNSVDHVVPLHLSDLYQ